MRRTVAYILIVLGASFIFIEQQAPLAGLGLLVSLAGFMVLSGGITR